MVKYLFFLLVIYFVAVDNLFSQVAIDIKMNMPTEVEAGSFFIVTIDINKGALQEFSRFQQELPAGLTVEQVNSATADYGFENQRLRFIWLKLPPDELISISYKVNVHQRLKGTFSLNGVFSYVEENERKSVDVISDTITILPSPLIAADKQVDISEFSQAMVAGESIPVVTPELSCVRQTPYLSLTGNELMVNLFVYKKDLDKFARIEETIPAGFEAKSVVAKDALFTFKDGTAKWVWMNLPPERGFTITYSLVPLKEQTLTNLVLSGKLTYIDGGNTISIDIVQKNVDLTRADQASADQLMANINNGQAVKTQTVALPETIKPAASGVQAETAAGTSTARAEVKETSERTTSVNIPAALLLPVQDGIYYRVQVAAFRKLNSIESIFGQTDMGKPVKIEFDEGLFKYTVGSFGSYNDAQRYKDELVSSRKVADAFVTAYRNGLRISVRQAMSLSAGN